MCAISEAQVCSFVISGFDTVFQFDHQLVELRDCVVPLLGVKVVKGFVIVTAEFLFGFSLEPGQFSPVPEQQMIGQLSDGVPRRKTDLDPYFQPEISFHRHNPLRPFFSPNCALTRKIERREILLGSEEARNDYGKPQSNSIWA